ncbi:helix-turn-helix transcriptional regulator [Roseicella aquatilis]|nr:helix-turn-helix transcriptional regulator [Roseicella aquatilis]
MPAVAPRVAGGLGMARQSKAVSRRGEPDQFLRGLGSRIREARKQAGLTGPELAEKVGTTRTWIYSVEEGRQNVTIQGLRRLLRALGLELQEVLPAGDLAKDLAKVRRVHQASAALILLLGSLLEDLQELHAATAAMLGQDDEPK